MPTGTIAIHHRCGVQSSRAQSPHGPLANASTPKTMPARRPPHAIANATPPIKTPMGIKKSKPAIHLTLSPIT